MTFISPGQADSRKLAENEMKVNVETQRLKVP